MYLICDEYGIIKTVGRDFLSVLGYKFTDLRDKFIGTVMSPYLSFLHSTYLLPMYRSMSTKQTETTHTFLSSSMSIQSRPLILYTKTREPVCAHLSVNHYKNESEGLFRMEILSVEKMDANLIYTSDISPPETSIFKESSIDMMVICLDMKESTNYLTQFGPNKMIEMHTMFHKTLVDLIKSEYYPYLYIHEIMGDGFCLIMNIEWGYSFTRFCASMVYSFLSELYQRTQSIIPFRAGVSYGKLHYGYMDHRLRFFGVSLHRAARYEHESRPGSFCSDAVYYDKLVSEGMFVDTNHENETVDLRGIGQTDIFHVHYVSEESPRMKGRYQQATQSLSKSGTPVMTRSTPSPELVRSVSLTSDSPIRATRATGDSPIRATSGATGDSPIRVRVTSESPIRAFPTTINKSSKNVDMSIFFDKDSLEDL